MIKLYSLLLPSFQPQIASRGREGGTVSIRASVYSRLLGTSWAWNLRQQLGASSTQRILSSWAEILAVEAGGIV